MRVHDAAGLMGEVYFHSAVEDDGDLEVIDRAARRQMVRSLASRPERGKPLTGTKLRGLRSLRIENVRVVYRLNGSDVLVIAVGPRRDNEVYRLAEKRYSP